MGVITTSAVLHEKERGVIIFVLKHAGVSQLVESLPSKQNVARSSRVSRSMSRM